MWWQDEIGPPALAFVRTVCTVLALDSALEEQVSVLRRNLLKLVHVREFAAAAHFQVSLLPARLAILRCHSSVTGPCCVCADD